MLYITTEDIVLYGTYEEPIYDHAPGYGTYITDKHVLIPQNTGIELNEDGIVKHIHKEISCGVSMHEGTFRCKENLADLIGTKLKPIELAEYNIIKEKEEKERIYREELWQANDELEYNLCRDEFLQEDIEEINNSKKAFSQEEYEKISCRLLENAMEYVHLLANLTFIKAKGY